jgi:hypothetical protein
MNICFHKNCEERKNNCVKIMAVLAHVIKLSCAVFLKEKKNSE